MDLQQIKYFLAVVDFGTFMAAAEQVHVSQPTLSAGIRKLEQSLNVQLFTRGSRSASLTPAGEQFHEQVRPAYNQLLSARSSLKVEQEKINLGVLNTIPMDHIAEIIRAYRLSNPHVIIELMVTDDEQLAEMFKTGKLDMVFTSEQNASKKFTRLFEEQLMIIVSSQHPFANRKELELQQLHEQAFIERVKCESWYDVHNEFTKQDIKPEIVYRAETDESVLCLVAAGLGISIMPARHSPYDVSFIPIKDFKLERHIVVLYSDSIHQQHIKCFYAAVLKKFGMAA